MTGLADAYSDDVGALQSPGRLQAGIALLVLGTLLALGALVVTLANPTEWGARRLAGVLGGLAAPALAGGVVVILPANRHLRAAAAIGASLTVLGSAMFWHAYPSHWLGHGRELTPYVTGIYFLGMLTILVCLFAGIATLKQRNDPGGTVSLQVGEGKTKVVRVTESGLGGLGGVGLLGGTPDGEVETQTNRPDRTRPSRSPATTSTVSDGGAEVERLESPEPRSRSSPASVADRYCGNCEHFRYVRTEQGMTPYCGLSSEYMDDMEACEDWSSNA